MHCANEKSWIKCLNAKSITYSSRAAPIHTAQYLKQKNNFRLYFNLLQTWKQSMWDNRRITTLVVDAFISRTMSDKCSGQSNKSNFTLITVILVSSSLFLCPYQISLDDFTCQHLRRGLLLHFSWSYAFYNVLILSHSSNLTAYIRAAVFQVWKTSTQKKV